MDVLDAIQNRKSVKSFDPNYKMTDEEIEKLFNLAILSPTAFNIQNWRFLVLQDPELRIKVREAAWGQPQVTDASLLVVLTADLKSWKKSPERYWNTATPEVRDYLLGAITQYYDGKDQVQRDEAMRSCGMAAQTLMLAAQGMGYESGAMDGFDFDKVGKLINIPEDHIISMFVAIGKPLAPGRARDRLPVSEFIIKDRF